MIINLLKSDLFSKEPDRRFCEEYDLTPGMWNLMYNRAKYLDYSINELLELYEIKTRKRISHDAMSRWMWRTEIYHCALPFIEKGAHTVVSEIFGQYEERLIKELTKHIKSGATKDSRIII